MDKAFDILGMPEGDRRSLVRSKRRSSIITGTFDGAIAGSRTSLGSGSRSRSRSRSRSHSGTMRPDSGVSEVQLPLIRAAGGDKSGGGAGGAGGDDRAKGIMSSELRGPPHRRAPPLRHSHDCCHRGTTPTQPTPAGARWHCTAALVCAMPHHAITAHVRATHV